MPSDNSRFRLLVKTAPGPAAVRMSLNGQRFGFAMTPLQVRLDDGQVGDFRRALGCLGRANLRMGPPQPFPPAVSGKMAQIFLETQVIGSKR